MEMASVTSKTIASGSTTLVASATAWTSLRVRVRNIPAGDCDCDGNQLDVLGVCGGDCVADADGDGICDVDDECVGQYDACGICTRLDRSTNADVPTSLRAIAIVGNQLDARVCGGDCVADADGDGVCDVEDDCVGQYDAWHLQCNSDRSTSAGVPTSPPATAIVMATTRRAGRVRGNCVADADGDGISDVEDDCVGQYDACGICNGPDTGLRVRVCQHPCGRLRL